MKIRPDEKVLVSLVTRNEERFIERCLDAVLAQSSPVRVRLFDNASEDRTVALARRFGINVLASRDNLGYCGGHNAVLRDTPFSHALLLNADCRIEPDFVSRLVAAIESHPTVGMAGGKLRRMSADGELSHGPAERPVLDSTGIYFTPSQRHFDRGGGEEDWGQYDRREEVFGITGAALLCRREFIEDVSLGDQFLDEDFFAYREDADLAWRGRLAGWSALYEPAARALHFRGLRTHKRARIDPLINYHSVKNRFLMRTKNMDRAVWRRCFPYLWLRDLGILAYLVAGERASLGALRDVWRLRPRTLEKRRRIQSARRAAAGDIAPWFSFRPVSRGV